MYKTLLCQIAPLLFLCTIPACGIKMASHVVDVRVCGSNDTSIIEERVIVYDGLFFSPEGMQSENNRMEYWLTDAFGSRRLNHIEAKGEPYLNEMYRVACSNIWVAFKIKEAGEDEKYNTDDIDDKDVDELINRVPSSDIYIHVFDKSRILHINLVKGCLYNWSRNPCNSVLRYGILLTNDNKTILFQTTKGNLSYSVFENKLTHVDR